MWVSREAGEAGEWRPRSPRLGRAVRKHQAKAHFRTGAFAWLGTASVGLWCVTGNAVVGLTRRATKRPSLAQAGSSHSAKAQPTSLPTTCLLRISQGGLEAPVGLDPSSCLPVLSFRN